MMKPKRLRSIASEFPCTIIENESCGPRMRGRSPFTVRFWGVRGSIACSGPRTARYGGNTSSLEVRCGERILLFDAGTGIRYLGKSLEGRAIDADIFLTHTHFAHVCGLPFFRPFFEPKNKFRLWAGHLG